MYKKSILLTREMNIEIECIAMCRTGRVYDKVLKLKTLAKRCFMTALNLSQALYPRNFLNDDWYKVRIPPISFYIFSQGLMTDASDVNYFICPPGSLIAVMVDQEDAHEVHIVNQVVIQQVTLVQNVSSGRELKTT